jgi:acyl-CoA thioesterase-1
MEDLGIEDRKRFTRRTLLDLKGGCDVTIVAFGDSITAGYAVRHGFPYFWKELLRQRYPDAAIRLINSGESGNTTIDGISRLDWDVLAYEPDLITINFGINDAAMGIDLEEFKGNLMQMIMRIRAGPGSEILLLSSQPLMSPGFDKLVLGYYDAIRDVAKIEDIGFVDVYSELMDRVNRGTPLASFILPGLDHPNEQGYRAIAEALMEFF